MIIANDTDFSGYMYEDNSLVNGWMAEGGYAYTCPAHGKNRTTIRLSLSLAGVSSLNKINTVQLNVSVGDRTGAHLFTINPKAKDVKRSKPLADDVVLIDDGGILVYLTGDWYVEKNYLCHYVVIVNNTDFSGYMYENGSLVNGWMAEGGYAYACPAYGKNMAKIKLNLSQAGVPYLSKINTIRLNVSVNGLEATQVFTINPDAADLQNSTPSSNDVVLIDDGGVLVFLTGDWYFDSNYICHDVIIVNNTEYSGYMHENDSLINGWLAEGGYAYACPAYGKNRTTIKLNPSQAGVTSWEEIDTIQLNVSVGNQEASYLFTYKD